MTKNKEEMPIEIVSLDEINELLEAAQCSNCGADITPTSSDEWGLCEECHADLETHDSDDVYRPLNFNVQE